MGALNDVQQKIVEDTDGAIMVLAGAGSGKTRVLTHRIAYILQNNFAYPSEILAITFTNKASNEMRERLFNMNLDAGSIWAQTFHSFCCRILRNEAHNIEGHNQNFSIYDDTDKKMVIKNILKQLNLKEDEYLYLASSAIADRKNKNLSILDYYNLNSFSSNIKTLVEIMQRYEENLKNNNAFDFDDLLIETLNLFKNNESILQKYSSRFKYILIDEFQDTNKVQYELVKMLAKVHKNIFAVGDEDQSIYSWRGANVQNIQRFLKDFENAKLYKLEQNYRSTKNILNCANKIIKFNTNRIDKTLWTDRGDGVKVQYVKCYNETEEAEKVVREIYNLTHNLDYSYKDIAILMRLNALTRSFEDKLLSYNIPYRIFGGQKFYDRLEIKNLLAYLKLLINPKDNESFKRIINFPKRGIGDSALNELVNASKTGESLFECVNSINENFCSKNLAKFIGFKKLMNEFLEYEKSHSVTELVQYIVENLDLQNVYNTDKEEDKNRMLNINEFITSISQFETENEDVTLASYLQSVSLITDLDTYNDDDNNVILSTVHASKGLEFKVVFIVALEEKYFPIIRDDSTIESMEEERRLMYVAITRAEERLYLTNASSRFMYGRTNYTMPSRFLAELSLTESNKEQRSGYKQVNDNNSHLYSNYNYGNNNLTNTTTKPSLLKENKSININVGDKVSHAKFGIGTAVSVDRSTDMIIIDFPGYGNKILSMKFAPISKVDN